MADLHKWLLWELEPLVYRNFVGQTGIEVSMMDRSTSVSFNIHLPVLSSKL